jgi:hypothetical protein
VVAIALRRVQEQVIAIRQIDEFATHRLPGRPSAYDIFQRKADGAIKIMLNPGPVKLRVCGEFGGASRGLRRPYRRPCRPQSRSSRPAGVSRSWRLAG